MRNAVPCTWSELIAQKRRLYEWHPILETELLELKRMSKRKSVAAADANMFVANVYHFGSVTDALLVKSINSRKLNIEQCSARTGPLAHNVCAKYEAKTNH